MQKKNGAKLRSNRHHQQTNTQLFTGIWILVMGYHSSLSSTSSSSSGLGRVVAAAAAAFLSIWCCCEWQIKISIFSFLIVCRAGRFQVAKDKPFQEESCRLSRIGTQACSGNWNRLHGIAVSILQEHYPMFLCVLSTA